MSTPLSDPCSSPQPLTMSTVSTQGTPPNRTRRPPVPTPESSSADVRQFLIQFFFSLDDTMTVTEAQDQAKKMRVDGKLLYQIPLERWVELYGDQGRGLFNELQESNWAAIGRFFPWLESSVVSSSCSPDPSSFSKENLFTKASFSSLLPLSLLPSSSSTTYTDSVLSSTAQDFPKDSKFERHRGLRRRDGFRERWSG